MLNLIHSCEELKLGSNGTPRCDIISVANMLNAVLGIGSAHTIRNLLPAQPIDIPQGQYLPCQAVLHAIYVRVQPWGNRSRPAEANIPAI